MSVCVNGISLAGACSHSDVLLLPTPSASLSSSDAHPLSPRFLPLTRMHPASLAARSCIFLSHSLPSDAGSSHRNSSLAAPPHTLLLTHSVTRSLLPLTLSPKQIVPLSHTHVRHSLSLSLSRPRLLTLSVSRLLLLSSCCAVCSPSGRTRETSDCRLCKRASEQASRQASGEERQKTCLPT